MGSGSAKPHKPVHAAPAAATAGRKQVHAELTQLLDNNQRIHQIADRVDAFFDDREINDVVEQCLVCQPAVATDGLAAVVTAGPPGVGKTTTVDDAFGDDLGSFRRIDPDIVKDLLLARADEAGLLDDRHAIILSDGKPVKLRELSPLVHTRSVDVARTLWEHSLDANENVIQEGTLRWQPLVARYTTELLDADYQMLRIVHVEAPAQMVIESARERWWDGRQSNHDGARFIPDRVIASLYPASGGQSECANNAETFYQTARPEIATVSIRRLDRTADGTATVTQRISSGYGADETVNTHQW